MNGTPSATGATAGKSATKGLTSAQVDFLAALEKLKEEASKTPEERARDDVLKKHNLSENDYRSLSADQRVGIDAEIKAAVQRVAEQRRANMAARAGLPA